MNSTNPAGDIVDAVSNYVGIDSKQLIESSCRWHTAYKRYRVRKRSGRGFRLLFSPSDELRAVQRAILDSVLRHLPVDSSATAYRPGLKSPLVQNARVHAFNRIIIRLDVCDFFNSIRPSDLIERFSAALGRPVTSDELKIVEAALFVPIDGELGLPVGAPTSPSASNIVMRDLDVHFRTKAVALGSAYSRYADDLFFSCQSIEQADTIISDAHRTFEATRSPNLSLNEHKTQVMWPGVRRRVSGIVIGPDGFMSIGRDKLRWIRSLVFKFSKGLLESEEVERLRGLLAFAISVDCGIGSRLIMKFGAETMRRLLPKRVKSRRPVE